MLLDDALKEKIVDDFLTFVENTLDIENVLRYKIEKDEWEELINEYFTDKFYEVESPSDLDLLNASEEYIRKLVLSEDDAHKEG